MEWRNKMTTIYWAGDSTVKENNITSYPQTGIGQGFELYIKKEIQMNNMAENGRSTKSFIEEGRLEPIDKQIKSNDFLFIQFGHNDSKEDLDRYTDPFGTYQENLKQFIDVALSHQAKPILITPLYRRWLEADGSIQEICHGDYPRAMIELGKEFNIPVIDLCTKSKALLSATDNKITKTWFMHLPVGKYINYPDGKEDNTHLQYEGAVIFAGLIAEEIRKLDNTYSWILLDESEAQENPRLLID